MNIKNLIKIHRIEQNLTQKELAEKSGVSERQLSRIEKGEENPKITTVYKIANTLGVTVEQLFGAATPSE